MKKHITVITIIVISTLISTGCATLLKGYEDSVRINNAPDSLRVYLKEGIELPIIKTSTISENVKINGKNVTLYTREINLRSNLNYTLVLKSNGEEKIVVLYPRLNFGWVFLDLLCGGIPSFYDAYTGSWNTFPEIDASFIK